MVVTPLADALLLLACDAYGADDVDETVALERRLELGLGGAVLADLALAGRVTVDDVAVRVGDSTPTGDLICDGTLAAIAADATPSPPVEWVTRLARGLRPLVQSRLIAKRVAQESANSRWGIVPIEREFPSQLEVDLRVRLREVVLRGLLPDGSIATLCGLLLALGMDRQLYPEMPRDAVKDRLTIAAEVEFVNPAIQATLRSARAVVTATALAIAAS